MTSETIAVEAPAERVPSESERVLAGYDLIGVAEAARLIGCATTRVRQLLASGDLTGQKNGRDWVIRRADVLAYQPMRPRAARANSGPGARLVLGRHQRTPGEAGRLSTGSSQPVPSNRRDRLERQPIQGAAARTVTRR